MKPVLIIASFFLILVSCYEPYTANIGTEKKIMVVEGLITNEKATYHIRLSYAAPFYTKGAKEPVTGARVYVTDEKNNAYPFSETVGGEYISDSQKFTGRAGSTYTLSIGSPDGNLYRSEPQKLLPVYNAENVSGEPGTREIFNQFTGQVSQSEGAVITADIKMQEEVIPGFRFSADLLRQYFYSMEIPPPMPYPPLYLFYCWQTDNYDAFINLAGNNRSLGSPLLVNKHEVTFVEDLIRFYALFYNLGSQQPDLSYTGIPTTERREYTVSRRIIYLNLFTLNNDSYLYYKRMDDQLRAEGKLFDPIAVQLEGNIKCVTNQELLAIGFFEASSVSRSRYMVTYKNSADRYSVVKLPYILPPVPDGCLVNKVPYFWVD